MRRVFRNSLLALSVVLAGCVARPCPQNVPDEPAPVDTFRCATIAFTGDVMQHSGQVVAARTADGYDYSDVFDAVCGMLQRADVAVVNLETTLNPDGAYSGYPRFAAPSQLADAISEAGVDVALLANNHICDRGSSGIASTIDALNAAGVAHTGVFVDSVDMQTHNPLMVDAGGFRVALLNYTYGTNGMPVPHDRLVNLIDTLAVLRDLARAEALGAEIRIVCLHWGEEYRHHPNTFQTALSDWLVSHGATAVIGSHPHVIEPFTEYRDSSGAIRAVTYFSLGNFVSNQRFEGTDGGAVATLHFSQRGHRPLSIKPMYTLTWVHTPFEKGLRRYRVLPLWRAERDVTDSTRTRLMRFAGGSRRLLSTSTAFTEI